MPAFPHSGDRRARGEMLVAGFGALVLDVGGVLIEAPTREARGAWERAHGLEQGRLDQILVEAIGPGWEGGRCEDEIEARLCAACEIDRSGLAGLLDALSADERVCPEWRRALDAISGRVSLALLTNSGPKTRTTLVARHRLERWFPVIVISAEEGMSKPDPRIYRRTCERLGRAPAECLFVDDRLANVEGAEAAGLGAVRFVSSRETIPVVLERLGLRG
ncbi:MAG: hypothetical protein DI570_15995 [Phenylobacterium zucineum]|nr:MAG: hypothetical protein DI570_15995 [Phenylobacterium zucineum]